jgi:hypothetical protein
MCTDVLNRWDAYTAERLEFPVFDVLQRMLHSIHAHRGQRIGAADCLAWVWRFLSSLANARSPISEEFEKRALFE